MANSSTSSTSQNASKTRKPFHFRAKIKVQNIQVIVRRNLRQNTIKLSIKNLKRKQSNNTQRKFIKIPVYFPYYKLRFTFLLRRCSRVYCYSCFFVTLFFYVVVLSYPVILVVLDLLRETGGESSAKFETPGAINQITDDMKQKCYIWGTRLKEDADGNTNEYEEMCTLIAQDEYILMRMHLASLQAKSDIESQIVSAICLILNQKNEKRFQEQIYCLPPRYCGKCYFYKLWSMALSDHPEGEFISPKTNKEFRVEDYPSFIPFIDRKKLTSHPYIFAPVCHSGHWWLWLINTTKRKCHILDPLHKKAPSEERKQINKFTGYVFSRLRAYAGGEPLQKDEKEKEIKASYVKISGQKTSYDCAIYVMQWLELIEPENIKKGKYKWDNWKQEEVDHYRVEYASWILFSEMNKQRDRAIRESSAIRLSKPSSVLLSPFCQINSADIETA
ncbi:hypothetical protein AHAS_Ahas16G0141800 [Arachis hypogaea]